MPDHEPQSTAGLNPEIKEETGNAENSRLWCDRQTQDWTRGLQTPIEHYVLESPVLADDETLLLDLIYNEVLLRERYAQPARLEEYETRFPHLKVPLQRLFEVHVAIESGDLAPSTARRTPDGDTHPASPSAMLPTGFPELKGYRFLEQIGRGAMGVVYRARQQGTDRDVAVKIFYGGIDASEEEVARFGIEAQAAARLKHPSIVSVHEAGVHEDVHYLAMEFIDGCTLAHRLVDGPLPPRDAAQLLETIAKAVHYANESGIIHRDLKPHNILIDLDGAPHIADFGLARFNDRNTTWTTGGRILGTLHYMSPEQVRGDQNAIGPGTDVYGLGAVLFQCLTGQPPFADRTAPQLVHDLLHRDPSLASRIAEDIPADLVQICRKSLEKEPSARYPDADAFADDLRRFLAGRPVSARPLPVASVTWRAIRRRPVVSSLVATTIALVIAFCIGSLAVAERLRESDIELSEVKGRADRAKTVGQYACVETNIAKTDRRLRNRNASLKSEVLSLVRSTIGFAEGLPPEAFRAQRLRTQVAAALSSSDIEPVLIGDAAEADFPPPPESVPRNAYSVAIGDHPDNLVVANASKDAEKVLSTGFDIEGIAVHPYVPVAAVWNAHDLHLVNLEDPDQTQVLATRATRRIQSLDWSDCGSLLAIGSADHFAYILQFEAHERRALDQPVQVLKGARSWVNQVRFVRDRLLMATCQRDDRTRLYDCDTGEEIISFRGSGDEVNWPGDRIQGQLEGEPAMWELRGSEIKATYSIANGIQGACALACNPRSDRFLICEWDEITLWDANDRHVLDKFSVLNPIDVTFIGDDRAVVLAEEGRRYLRLADTADRRRAKLMIEEIPVDPKQPEFGLDDLALATQFPILVVTRDDRVDLFGLNANRLTYRESVDVCEATTYASCSNNGKWLATSVEGDNGFELHHLSKGTSGVRIETEETVVGFRFNANSNRLLVGGPSRCTWYDLASGEQVGAHVYPERGGNDFGMEWSPDGSLIASTNRADSIDLIDSSDGQLLVSLPVSQSGSWVRFTPDGEMLLCRDSSFRLVTWDLAVLRSKLGEMELDW